MTRGTDAKAEGVDIGAYCREVEAHLCRVNGGHLVRIVGPAFLLVSGWASEGIPVRIVLHGVDRTQARRAARGPQRRPLRIEFCEADVRDAFEQWRRAVGAHVVQSTDAQTVDDAADGPASPAARGPSLPRHIERVLVRLSALLATGDVSPLLRDALGAAIGAADACLDQARGARGDARATLIAKLGTIDEEMTSAAVRALSTAEREDLRRHAAEELAPHRGSMPAPALADAEATLLRELARRRFLLPQVRLDG
ncbi:MAG: hypothetical protein IT182_17595 [Acidobacteria bacterium]|nr:hypothetical protein [Acidobacteriota bacterium]